MEESNAVGQPVEVKPAVTNGDPAYTDAAAAAVSIKDQPGGNCFVNALVKCPCCMAIVVMMVSIFCIVIMMIAIMAEGSAIFGSVQGGDIGDVRTDVWDALLEAQKQSRTFQVTGDELCGEDRMGGGGRTCASGKRAQQTEPGEQVLMAYVAKGGTLFTANNLNQMKQVEDKIINDPKFKDYCKRHDKTGVDTTCERPMSVLNLFFVNGTNTLQTFNSLDAMDGASDGKLDVFSTPELSKNMAMYAAGLMSSNGTLTSQQQKAKQVYNLLLPFLVKGMSSRGDTLQDVDATLKLAAYMSTVPLLQSQVDFYFDKTFSLSSLSSTYSRSVIAFGLPLKGYENQDDRPDEQKDSMVKWFEDSFNDYLKDTKEAGNVEVLWFASPLVLNEFLSIIVFDALKVIISIAAVFLWLWFQTKSFFIAVVGMVEILLSIPLAFFFYRTVCGFKYFDGLNAMTIFIVVAIGADDIFVFMDAYKQSTYNYEACVSLKSRMNWVYSRAATAMFVTSMTTCAAFLCTATSPLLAMKSFGIFSAFVIAADYILVVTWFPACVVLFHNHFEKRPCCFWCCYCDKMCGPMTTTTETVRLNGPEAEPPKRTLERFFGGRFSRMIRGPFEGAAGLLSKGFAPWILLGGTLLMIPLLLLATSISGVSSSEEGLPSDHPFQRVWTIYGEQFPQTANTPNTAVYVLWGVDGMDRDGVNLLRDVDNIGTLMWDETFSFDEAAQRHIYNVCIDVEQMRPARVSNWLSRDSDDPRQLGWLKCPLKDWKEWLEQSGGPGFPLPLSQVSVEMPKFLSSNSTNSWGGSQTMKEKWKNSLAFDGTKVKMVMINVRSNLATRINHPNPTLSEAYDYFEGWTADINANDRLSAGVAAPATANKALQTSDGDFNGPLWVWMNTQSVFVTSAFMGASLGAGIAFLVILAFTQQIIIAFAAVLTILCVLTSVLAMMKIADYELGTITAISISILAGFAVDFVVHLAHSYAHCEKPTRSEKVQHVFDEIAVSVFSGMLTSVVAAFVLLFCTLQFFAKFGFFLIVTVSWAWIWGNFFFMSFMRLMGPDDSTHWLLRLPGSVTWKYIEQLKAKKWR